MTAFDGASNGDAAPVREIIRDLSLGSPLSIFFEPSSSQIFAIGFNSPTWNITGLIYLPHSSVTFSGIINKATNGLSCFGMVVDKFGVSWMVNIAGKKA